MSLPAGAKLGPYEILAPLGSGGMGEVYRARDPRLGRDIAIKVLNEKSSGMVDGRARFEREARAAAALNHPNILAVSAWKTASSTLRANWWKASPCATASGEGRFRFANCTGSPCNLRMAWRRPIRRASSTAT